MNRIFFSNHLVSFKCHLHKWFYYHCSHPVFFLFICSFHKRLRVTSCLNELTAETIVIFPPCNSKFHYAHTYAFLFFHSYAVTLASTFFFFFSLTFFFGTIVCGTRCMCLGHCSHRYHRQVWFIKRLETTK